MNNGNFEKGAEQAAAYQKIWMESLSKMFQAACTMAPNAPPPEIVRQMREGIFAALAKSWEEFMRSPQFLEGMRQCMENAITFRKMTNEFMAKVRNELQSPSKDDIDTVMLSVRHMERRLLDRVEELAAQGGRLNERLAKEQNGKRAARAGASNRTVGRPARNTRVRVTKAEVV